MTNFNIGMLGLTIGLLLLLYAYTEPGNQMREQILGTGLTSYGLTTIVTILINELRR